MLSEIYCKGQTWVHTTRPAIKLVLLFILCTALFVVEAWSLLVISGVGVALLYQQARIPFDKIYLSIKPALVILVLIFIVQLFLAGVNLAAFVVLRFMIMIFAASLLTLTTPTSALIATIENGVRKVAPPAVAEGVALAFSLSLRFIPQVRQTLEAVKESQRARGLHSDWRALATPTVVRTLKSADEIAQAITARNIDTSYLTQQAKNHECK